MNVTHDTRDLLFEDLKTVLCVFAIHMFMTLYIQIAFVHLEYNNRIDYSIGPLKLLFDWCEERHSEAIRDGRHHGYHESEKENHSGNFSPWLFVRSQLVNVIL